MDTAERDELIELAREVLTSAPADTAYCLSLNIRALHGVMLTRKEYGDLMRSNLRLVKGGKERQE